MSNVKCLRIVLSCALLAQVGLQCGYAVLLFTSPYFAGKSSSRSTVIVLFGAPLKAADIYQKYFADIYVEAFDLRLVYAPSIDSWTRNFNPQPGPNATMVENYFHAGEYRATIVQGASVSLTFNGSYIAYYSDLHSSHGFIEIDLDGNKTAITTFSPLPYGTPQLNLFDAHVHQI
ncbi:hypothetical protein AURDEDRAFT_160395 [Auricularia subglabra TFB-10046 SS5]|nr:hypothetical protein AURDEDRAFT_160395 [Auricularia subglabra TFB-10046 SS5]